MSTGQGVLGNNMFAYCNNNPVVGYDPTGSVPQNAFFYVCYDGVGGKPISGHSDGENGSDALLEYVCNNFMPNTNSTVYVDVTYVGIYTQKTSSNVSDFFAILGGISLFALIPAVKEVAMLSGMLTVAGTASSVYGLVGLFTPETLPDKDYYQYKVTISWVETTTVVGYPDVFVQTRYNVMMWFLWDDTSYTSPTWYAQNSSWDEYRTEFHIKGG